MRPFRAARVADDSAAGWCDKDIFSSAEDGTLGVCVIVPFFKAEASGFSRCPSCQAKTEFCSAQWAVAQDVSSRGVQRLWQLLFESKF